MINLSEIIKRLELIKNLISLEEDDAIAEQINKVKQLQTSEEVQEIINLLQQKTFGKAVIVIEAFLSKHNQLAFYIDPEIEALRFEAKALEGQIQERSDEKAELDKLIHEFNVRHTQELGQLISRALKSQ